MLNRSVTEFTEVLASRSAVPGGGGASALVGAIGIALGNMVGELTVGKKKYADVEEDVKALMDRAQDLRVRLLACVNKDAEAFEPLSRAYGIPKEDPARDEIMELQQEISADKNEALVGTSMNVIIEGYIPEDDVYVARSYRDAPDVDGMVFLETDRELISGTILPVVITGATEYDLTAKLADASEE